MVSFRNKDGISSKPIADFRFNFLRCFKTSSSLTLLKIDFCLMKLTLVGFALHFISVTGKVVLFKRSAADEKNLQNPSAMLCFSVRIFSSILRKVVVNFEDFDFVG